METSVVISCVGCGANISNTKGKQTLCSEASQHVQPLWCQLFDEELQCKGRDEQAYHLLSIGKMCRKCFTCFEKCTKTLNLLKENVVKAVEVFQQVNMADTIVSPHTASLAPLHSHSYAHPPVTKRLAVSVNSSRSPDVVVGFKSVD